jgi:hypothetical protein
MQGMWRKKLLPHKIRQRKTMQTKKATALKCGLVEILKPNPPHKERKRFTALSVDPKILAVLFVVCCTISLQAFSFAEPKTQLFALSAGR